MGWSEFITYVGKFFNKREYSSDGCLDPLLANVSLQYIVYIFDLSCLKNVFLLEESNSYYLKSQVTLSKSFVFSSIYLGEVGHVD